MIRDPNQLLENQRNFIRKIVLDKLMDRELIYLDETSFHGWDYQHKTWQDKQHPFVHKLPTRIRKSRTIIGAISSHNMRFRYRLIDSTNRADVLTFVRSIFRLNPHNRRRVLVLDNHSAHKYRGLKDYLFENNIELLYLPVSSSHLNPIGK